MPKPIEIMRAGRHTDVRGQVVEFREADLAAIAAAYDPALHEAPIVVGHPALNAPAYGWVAGLSARGDRLDAAPKQVDAEFAELVKDGRFKKVSASFYPPASSNNPKPGTWYLRHVGFLGAAAPAVKGLRQVEFAGGDEDAVTVEFGDWSDRGVARLFRGLRDWLIEQFGSEAADKALPPWEVDAVQEEAAKPEPVPAPAFAESEQATSAQAPQEYRNNGEGSGASASSGGAPPTSEAPDPVASTDADFAERERRLAEREAAFAARERRVRRQEHGEFADSIVAQGRPLPCAKELLVEFMAHLDGDDAVSFGEQDRTPLEVFQTEILARLPKQVSFGEQAAPEPGEGDIEDPVQFAERIEAYQAEQRKKGRHVSATDAARALKKGTST